MTDRTNTSHPIPSQDTSKPLEIQQEEGDVEEKGFAPIDRLTPEELAKGKQLHHDKKEENLKILIPVPEEAEPFDQETPAFMNQIFGYYPTAYYAYHTQEGKLAGYMVRWEIPQEDGSFDKQMRPYIYAEDRRGNKQWRCKGFPTPRPLYHLPELYQRPNAPILICEGEKTADAGGVLFPDYVSTTSPHGAKSLRQADWSHVRGKKVIISPDFDTPGQDWCETLTELCKKAGASSIQYCFPEMFHILRLAYFENLYKASQSMQPRINVEKLFSPPLSPEEHDNEGEGEEAEDNDVTPEKENETTENDSCKAETPQQKPLTVKAITENASEDVAMVIEEAEFYDADMFDLPFDPQGITPQGYDLADVLKEGWTANTIKVVIEEAGGEDKIFPARLVTHLKKIKTAIGIFILKTGGVYLDGTKICGFLRAIASCRNEESQQWTLLVEFVDKDSKMRELLIPMTAIVKDGSGITEMLSDAGLWVNVDPKEGRQNIKYYLNQTPKERRVLVRKVGWYQQNYVLPHKTWGEEVKEKHVFHTKGKLPTYEEKGTLEEWNQQIGAYLEGNSRLLSGVCMTLASTLLTPLGRQNFGFHHIGNSSIGKSTILAVVSSVFGTEVKTWRTTDNCAESWMRDCNDNIMCMDELGKAPSASVVSEMLYLLGDGQGKGRANIHGDAKEVTQFKSYVLTSGEMGFEEKMQQGFGKRTFYAGQSVRIAEIQSDAGKGWGIYENLYTFKNGAELSDHLVKASSLYRGTLGDTWLTYVAEQYHSVLKKAEEYAALWLQQCPLEQGIDGQVIRVMGHLSLMAAVGEVVIEAQILPCAKGSAFNALKIILNDWLRQRGGVESHENMEVVKKLTMFIEEHGSSRFGNPWNTTEDEQTGLERADNEKIINRAGFRQFVDGRYIYYFLSNVFTRDILGGAKGATQKALLRKLAKEGYIQAIKEKRVDRDVEVYSQRVHIPSYGTQRVYIITTNL